MYDTFSVPTDFGQPLPRRHSICKKLHHSIENKREPTPPFPCTPPFCLAAAPAFPSMPLNTPAAPPLAHTTAASTSEVTPVMPRKVDARCPLPVQHLAHMPHRFNCEIHALHAGTLPTGPPSITALLASHIPAGFTPTPHNTHHHTNK